MDDKSQDYQDDMKKNSGADLKVDPKTVAPKSKDPKKSPGVKDNQLEGK